MLYNIIEEKYKSFKDRYIVSSTCYLMLYIFNLDLLKLSSSAITTLTFWLKIEIVSFGRMTRLNYS